MHSQPRQRSSGIPEPQEKWILPASIEPVAGLDAAAITAANVTNNGGTDKTLKLSGMTADYTYAGTITDGTTNKLALTMDSAGKLKLLTGTNLYTGDTTVTAGTLKLDGSTPATAPLSSAPPAL